MQFHSFTSPVSGQQDLKKGEVLGVGAVYLYFFHQNQLKTGTKRLKTMEK